MLIAAGEESDCKLRRRENESHSLLSALLPVTVNLRARSVTSAEWMRSSEGRHGRLVRRPLLQYYYYMASTVMRTGGC